MYFVLASKPLMIDDGFSSRFLARFFCASHRTVPKEISMGDVTLPLGLVRPRWKSVWKV